MAIANKGKFPNELDLAIHRVFMNSLLETTSEYQLIAKEGSPDPGEAIVESEISGLGAMEEMVEGGGVIFDVPEEGHKVARYYSKFGLGFQVTEEAIQDSVHKNIMKMPAALGESAVQTINTEFFDLFNSGFDTHTAADGFYIFDTDRTLLKSTATLSNTPATPGDLSETTLQAAFEYFWSLKTEEGFPAFMEPNELLIPYGERWTANKLLSGDRVLGSANNDYLTTNPANGMVPTWKVTMSRYLTDTDAWFLLSPKHDFRIVFKKKPSLESTDDFSTGNRLYKNVIRFAAFCNWYKGCYGNPGA
jgi:hypothetical protein